jgi:hypothetical protein
VFFSFLLFFPLYSSKISHSLSFRLFCFWVFF